LSGPENQPAGGYDPAFFAALAEAEDRQFWFRSRNDLISRLAARISAGFPPGHRVLEVGFGTGNVLRFLKRACAGGDVFGMELWPEGIRLAQGRKLDRLVQGDLKAPPFRAVFDLVGLFDVLEHIPDDHATLRAMSRLLAPRGCLLITVPAHAALWSYFDEAAHHCRRYSPAALREVLARAGFQVEYLSQFMATLFPLVWLVRRVAAGSGVRSAARNRKLAQDEFRVIPLLNPLLNAILSLEVKWLSAGRTLPFGTSIIAIARRIET